MCRLSSHASAQTLSESNSGLTPIAIRWGLGEGSTRRAKSDRVQKYSLTYSILCPQPGRTRVVRGSGPVSTHDPTPLQRSARLTAPRCSAGIGVRGVARLIFERSGSFPDYLIEDYSLSYTPLSPHGLGFGLELGLRPGSGLGFGLGRGLGTGWRSGGRELRAAAAAGRRLAVAAPKHGRKTTIAVMSSR